MFNIMTSLYLLGVLTFLTFCAFHQCSCVHIVQSLSSNYALVLGGFGPGYEELRKVGVVKHNKVCPNVIRYVKRENVTKTINSYFYIQTEVKSSKSWSLRFLKRQK